MNLIPILDAGHGGVINNVYHCRAGGRQVVTDKFAYYEGESNRSIVARIAEKLAIQKIPYYILAPECTDTTLSTRANRANEIYKTNRNVYVASFHSNAGGGTGFEVFTSVGDTPSDPIAAYFGKLIKREFPDFRYRMGVAGKYDKEADYTILKTTHCPAVLFENLFFDNPADLAFLLDYHFREQLSIFYATAMKGLYLKGL